MAIAVERLEKIYKEKGDADVRALKGISFDLPDRGIVFILGKSGCGKSTLLNVLGGLDGFDGGDIVIDGKSLKDYKARDLDGYRNEYVGFVFQENNLLEKESVRRNVSLAVELQSEKNYADKVTAALESVELEDFENRKCNRLSGGQKQRVAIARALIKEPKLLLCDEPTGALDSETGEGIFTLLKKLSGDRLVVVVSHDRESAEKYGDRIIELKDGEIISDSNSEKVIEPRNANGTEKSKKRGLGFLRSFTTGAGYIIAKPVRMAICLLLCLITFTCVGVADTVNAFGRDKAMLYTMESLGNKCYSFGRVGTDDGSYFMNMTEMSLEQAEELTSFLNVERADKIYRFANYDNYAIMEVIKNGSDTDYAFYANISGYLETDEKLCADYGFELVAGRLPQNFDEVAIPLYIFDFFKTFGYGKFVKEDYVQGEGYEYEYSDRCEINSFDDLLGKTISFYSVKNGDARAEFKISGIIDNGQNIKKINDVLFNGAEEYDGFGSELTALGQERVYNTAFVCKGFRDYFINSEFYSEYNDVCNTPIEVMCVIAPFTGSDSEKLENIRIYERGTRYADNKYGEGRYHLTSVAAKKIVDAEKDMYYIKNYSLYVVLAVAAISILFLTYYASGTISDKRKEIGILRAMGASRWDIVKIFACEHGVFTIVALILSTVASVVSTVILNASFAGVISGVVLIKFGIRQFAVMTAVAVVSVAAGVSVPLIRLLRAKPVDVIADRK